MRTHETTIGEGAASVTCHYHFDADGDLDGLNVILEGVDIILALTEQQLAELEDKCRVAANADYEEQKGEALISRYLSRMDAA
jgi:hypothetical protein